MKQISSFRSDSFRLLRWVLALQLVLAMMPSITVEASCPGFRLGTTSCSSGIFSRSHISASCSDDEDDGKVAVSGTVTAPYEFDADASVKFVPCIRSTDVCFENYTQDGGKVCDYLTSNNGYGCGASGKYSVYGDFDIPDEVVKDHSWTMRFVTIKVLIDNEEACTQNATSDASSEAFMASGMASLFAVGGLGLYFVRRRRKPLLVLDVNEQYYYGEQSRVGQFVHMNDLSPSVSSIGIRGAFSLV